MASLRILVIDDQRIVCERLSGELSRLGFTVEATMDSADAMARLETERFDVVVTDLKMHGPSGMEVLARVRERWPDTKVIVITGFATVETAREALHGGAVDFLAKPFRLAELRELVLKIAEERDGR